MNEEDKVVRLHDRKPVDSEPYVDEVLVEKLESMLADARAGKAFCMGLAAVTSDNGCVTFSHVPKGLASVPLLGVVSRLLHNLHKDLDK